MRRPALACRALAGLALAGLAAGCGPGELQAGSARVRMPVPPGIGTAGFNGLGPAHRGSRFRSFFAATENVLGHPDLKAVVLRRDDEHEVVLLRVDMVAVTEPLRAAVVEEVRRRTGRDLSRKLVAGATHTHSGPGRFIEGALFSIMVDKFFPQFFHRLVGAMADAVEQAYADLGPAELGHVVAQAPDAHEDRRCEDLEDHRDDSFPLLVVRRDGRVRTVVGAYATHGTVFGVEELFLSQDVNGPTERWIEDSFDHPVDALVFNSWGADMRPRAPALEPAAPLSPAPGGHGTIDRVGAYLAQVAAAAVAGVVTTDEPDLESAVYRYPITREAIGYAEGEFPYPDGGVYCGKGEPSCEEARRLDGMDRNCVAIPEDSAQVKQAVTGVGRIGGLSFVTWSGECGTRLSERVRAQVRELTGTPDTLFFGYSNSYHGYAIGEADWWHGGYEATGAMWGPRQGEHFGARIVDAVRHHAKGTALPFAQPAALPGPDLEGMQPWDPEPALEAGTIVAQPSGTYPASAEVTVRFHADDPWWGAPRATLERQTPGGWETVKRPGGQPYDSDGAGFWAHLDVDPPHGTAATVAPMPRHFTWTYHYLPTRIRPAFAGAATGTFRLRLALPTAAGSTEIATEPFVVQ